MQLPYEVLTPSSYGISKALSGRRHPAPVQLSPLYAVAAALPLVVAMTI